MAKILTLLLNHEKRDGSWAWWCAPVIRRIFESKASLGYIVKPCLKKKRKMKERLGGRDGGRKEGKKEGRKEGKGKSGFTLSSSRACPQ
jgi:hypothetical protein